MSEDNAKQKVLVVGWDAADWKVIHPLLDKGVMPNLKNMIEQGVMGDITTLHPVLSPMLWTSIATGKRPYKHGIYGFMEPTPDGLNVQPITNLSRHTKAVWNILNQNDMRSLVVGWWPSHPAEPINGAMVSNNYHRSTTLEASKPWPMISGVVHPSELSAELAEVRMHPGEIDQELINPFIPLVHKIDQDTDRRLWMFCKTLAECISIHGAATHLMETQEWNLAAIYFDAIDHFSHGFMRYHPPRQEHVKEEDFEIYQHIVECAYVYHDMMLGRLLELAGEDANVMLLSDHGFHPDHLRPRFIPSEPTGPAIEHRDQGIFVIKGPGIKKDELIHGVSLLDVTPTILQLFGLPVGDDMDGRVIKEAFAEDITIETIPSWDDKVGPDGQHPPERQMDAHESKEALQQLVDLGYIEPLDENQEKNVEKAISELNYNLARAYMDAHFYGDAVGLLHDLYCKHPSEYRYGIQLAICFKALNRVDDLDRLVANLEQQRASDAKKAQAELENYKIVAEQRREALAAKKSAAGGDENKQQNETVSSAKDESTQEEQAGSAVEIADDEIFSQTERLKISHLVGLTRVNLGSMQLLRGFVSLAQGEPEDAIKRLEKMVEGGNANVGVYLQMGEAYLKLKNWDEAQNSLVKAHELNPDDAQVLLGLARCHLGRRENEQAVELALQSAGLSFFNPMTHYCLGVAFHRLGRIERAVDALQLSLSQNPNNARAHGRLGYIFRNELEDLKSSQRHFAMAAASRDATKKLHGEAKKLKLPAFDETDDSAIKGFIATAEADKVDQSKDMLPSLQTTTVEESESKSKPADGESFITIVTGLPRTGTSMMMQMLNAGGLGAMTDGNRVADEDNPKGYFELDDAKKLATNNKWVSQADGKVIKVVAQLIPYLPKELNYRVIFMDRPLDEVLASQHTMLGRQDQTGAQIDEEQLKQVFQRQLQLCVDLLRRNRIPTFRAPYRQAIANPQDLTKKINEFLGGDLDVNKMVASVDPSLYRQRQDQSIAAQQST